MCWESKAQASLTQEMLPVTSTCPWASMGNRGVCRLPVLLKQRMERVPGPCLIPLPSLLGTSRSCCSQRALGSQPALPAPAQHTPLHHAQMHSSIALRTQSLARSGFPTCFPGARRRKGSISRAVPRQRCGEQRDVTSPRAVQHPEISLFHSPNYIKVA